jgi:hypothetical protein
MKGKCYSQELWMKSILHIQTGKLLMIGCGKQIADFHVEYLCQILQIERIWLNDNQIGIPCSPTPMKFLRPTGEEMRKGCPAFPVIDLITTKKEASKPLVRIGSYTTRKGMPPDRVRETKRLMHAILLL